MNSLSFDGSFILLELGKSILRRKCNLFARAAGHWVARTCVLYQKMGASYFLAHCCGLWDRNMSLLLWDRCQSLPMPLYCHRHLAPSLKIEIRDPRSASEEARYVSFMMLLFHFAKGLLKVYSWPKGHIEGRRKMIDDTYHTIN